MSLYTKHAEYVDGPFINFVYLVSGEICITMFCKLFLEYVVFTNLTLTRF